ncbi:unnamed protein product [Trichogramma brassicae]|uniref:Uncharacterized protein n=1 Tax=Trichogramma brassicae TaxID=86971 RepID=A0A6H5HXZ5_9HYME|nr:unnamed protein product [Trichogramma brassicae]
MFFSDGPNTDLNLYLLIPSSEVVTMPGFTRTVFFLLFFYYRGRRMRIRALCRSGVRARVCRRYRTWSRIGVRGNEEVPGLESNRSSSWCLPEIPGVESNRRSNKFGRIRIGVRLTIANVWRT